VCNVPFVAAIVTAVLSLIDGPAVQADDSTKIEITRKIVVKDLGEAQFEIKAKMAAAKYTQVKSDYPNMEVLVRRFGVGLGNAKIEDVKGKLDDASSTVTIEYRQPGFARITDNVNETDLWKITLDHDTNRKAAEVSDNVARFNTTIDTDLGSASVVVRIEVPHGAKDLKLLDSQDAVTYQYKPVIADGTNSDHSFTLETRPIMPALGRAYGESRYTNLWIARTVFKNTGDQALSDYQVCCQFQGFEKGKGDVKQTRRVLPGQTIVDVFYFDLDTVRLAQLTSPQREWIAAEYQFRRAGDAADRPVIKTSKERVQLLGRNQVRFTNLSDSEAVGFYDKYCNAPVILPAFVTGNDPVVQALATRLKKLSPTTNSISTSNDDAEKFIEKLYESIRKNKVEYQSSFGDTVQYAREVIEKRSATSIDLAILVAAVCDAVNLKSTLYLTPTECLPAVQLPNNDKVIVIDVTKINDQLFAAGKDEGAKKLDTARSKNQLYTISVTSWRSADALALDLPKVEQDYLDKRWDMEGSAPSLGDKTKLVGRWFLQKADANQNAKYALEIMGDGKYRYEADVKNPNQSPVAYTENGTYQADNNSFTVKPDNGQPQVVYRYTLRKNDSELNLQMQGATQFETFNRVK
jgi:hypothetical protein